MHQDSPARSTPIPFTSSADTSILPIVTSQRDRFRQRNAELEEVRWHNCGWIISLTFRACAGAAEAIPGDLGAKDGSQGFAIRQPEVV